MKNELSEVYVQTEPIFKTKIYKKLLPACCTFWLACILVCIIISVTLNNNATVCGITISAISVLCILSALVILLFIMPKMRIKQAQEDIKNYDFTPYTANGEKENFYNEIPIEIHCFYSSNHFDEQDNEFAVDNKNAIKDYLDNFPQESRLKVVYLDPFNEFLKLYTFGTENNIGKLHYLVNKKTEGELTEVLITEQHEVTFTENGLKIGDVLYSYKKITATAEATFTFNIYARIMLDCGNGIGASFAISPKIIAVLDKFGMAINDRFIADFILADPAFAFDKIAKLASSKRIKKYVRKIR